jgi:hypothetical protein
MAIIKSKTLPNGATGDYWRIIQRNSNFERDDDVVTLQLYLSKELRDENYQPLNDSVQFNFHPGDHPLSDFDPDRVGTVLVDDFRDLELHVRYLHIKDIATHAKKLQDDFIPTEENLEVQLTGNETLALFFHDSQDDLL